MKTTTAALTTVSLAVFSLLMGQAILAPAAWAEPEVIAWCTPDFYDPMPYQTGYGDRFLFLNLTAHRITKISITLTNGLFFDTVEPSDGVAPGPGVQNPGWDGAHLFRHKIGQDGTGVGSRSYQFPAGAPTPTTGDGAVGLWIAFANPSSSTSAAFDYGWNYAFAMDVDGWNAAGLASPQNGDVIATGWAICAGWPDTIYFDVVYANTHIVKPDGSGDYGTIQAAINGSVDGDIVELWRNDDDTDDANPVPFTGAGNRDLTLLHNGDVKAITIRSKSGNRGRWTGQRNQAEIEIWEYDPDGAYYTIIDCDGVSTDQHRGFRFDNDETEDTRLVGIMIRNGYYSHGGAIYGSGTARPTIVSCMLVRCEASFGGAIYGLDNFAPWVIASTICSNQSAGEGGGVFLSQSDGDSPFFIHCWINMNYGRNGGGMYLQNSTTNCCTCRFTENSATDRGGAVYSISSDNTMCHCTFIGNTAVTSGATGHAAGGTNFNYYFCTINGNKVGWEDKAKADIPAAVLSNRAADAPGIGVWSPDRKQGSPAAISAEEASTINLESTILAFSSDAYAVVCEGGATATATCCDVYGNEYGNWVEGLAGQNGQNCNMSENPMFCGAATGNVTLRGDSPCAQENNPCGQLIGFWPVACEGSGCNCPGGQEEGEPPCHDEYEDHYNGGCNSVPPVFQVLEPVCDCPITVYGASGTFLLGGENARDTDWYEITADEMTDLTFCCVADFPLLIVLVDGNQGCGNPPIMDMTSGPPGEEICLVAGLDPGIYWLWVGPSVFEGVPCGSFYEMNVYGLSAPCAAPVVTGHPQDESVELGEPVAFTVVAEGDAPMTYQWRKDGADIDGATEDSYSISPVGGEDAGHYDVIVGNPCGSVTSYAATLSVTGLTAVPVGVGARETELVLEANVPNPFNPETTIAYRIPTASHVRLDVYDAGGRLVRNLADSMQQPGRHTFVWNGCDTFGSPVASGVYFYRLVAGGNCMTKKMVLLK
jgi:hypothetical protein